MKEIFVLVLLCFVIDTNAQLCFHIDKDSSIATYPMDLIYGDFNNDNIPDIVIGDSIAHSAFVYGGDGNGRFSVNATVLNLNTNSHAMATADFNHDNNLDIVFGGDDLQVFYGDGNGNFSDSLFQFWTIRNTVATGDFNNDGFVDIVSGLGFGNDSISIFMNNGFGGFDSIFSVYAGLFSYYAVTGNLNGDAYTDIVVLMDNGMCLMNGNGNATFSTPTYLHGVNYNYVDQIVLTDLNGDNLDDILFTSRASEMFIVELSNGPGTYIDSIIDWQVWKFAVADFNADGFKDVAGTIGYYGADAGKNVKLYFGTGMGFFDSTLTFEINNRAYGLVADDFNNDSLIDIVAVNIGMLNDNITILTNSDGINQFSTIVINPPCHGDTTGSVTVSVSGNSPPFLFQWNNTAAQTNSITAGQGTYEFMITSFDGCKVFGEETVLNPLPLSFKSINSSASCGANGLSDVSAIVQGGTGTYSYLWNSNPVQTSATAVALTSGEYIITATDSNNCQIADTINVGPALQLSLVGTFPLAATSPRFMITEDLNGDTKTDIATLNDNNTISILINYVAGTFLSPFVISIVPNVSGAFTGFKCADFNGDGFKDLVATKNHMIYYYPGSSSGIPGSPIVIYDTLIHQIDDFAVGFLDSDNLPDLAIVDGASNQQHILLGNVNGGFTFGALFTTSINSRFKILAADFNNDNITDLALSGGTTTDILEGMGNGTFSLVSVTNSSAGSIDDLFFTIDGNHDNNLDIFTFRINQGRLNRIYGNGNFGFTFHSNKIISNVSMEAIGYSSLNNDNEVPDLLHVDYLNELNIHLNDSADVYYIPTTYPIGSRVSAISTDDFNGDSKTDIALALVDSNQVMVLSNCIVTSIESEPELNKLNIYPNPSSGLIHIETRENKTLNLAIRNLNGQILKSSTIVGSMSLDIRSLANGLYIIQVDDGINSGFIKFAVVK